jgi:multidrug efflux pump subunit AcrA (membrane-fusion protein)
MKKRQIFIVLALVVFALGLFTSRKLMSMRKAPERKSEQRIARSVSTTMVQNDTVALRIPVNGKLKSKLRTEIFPEVTGILLPSDKPFKVGQTFIKGEVLLAMDGTESLLNLQSQRSSFAALVSQMLPDIKLDYPDDFAAMHEFFAAIEPNESLPPYPNAENVKYEGFLTSRNFYQQYLSIKSLENRQSKFTVRAPYNGTVSLGDLNSGTLLRAGQKAGEFISTGRFELETALSVDHITNVNVGDKIEAQSGDTWFSGTVSRISGNIDPATQRILVYSNFSGSGLRDGMYMEGWVHADNVLDAFVINRNLITRQNEIYVVNDSLLNTLPIEVIHFEAENALVKGLPEGTLILDQILEGAYVGMLVKSEMK